MSSELKTYKVIGLMSGTSLDGLDIVYCHIKQEENRWSFYIQQTKSVEYPPEFKNNLQNTVNLKPVNLLAFNNSYGTWLGTQVKGFISQYQLNIDFVSSHGHTVFHQPEMGITYQIGSGQHIANVCKQKVICDFRTNDVALGGQGAPLVPIGDKLLFNEYDFCLNLGGISNISFDHSGKRIAYDIAPTNMLLNHMSNRLGLAYDDRGKLAQSGTINPRLLKTFNALDYYKKTYPKSLGYEWFVTKILPILSNTQDSVENILHTSVHHIAEQIAITIQETKKENASLFITGGGAKNHFLIEVLTQKLQQNTIVILPDELIIDYKEALIFAFMGVLRDRKEVNCLASVTGATKDSSSGVIYNPA